MVEGTVESLTELKIKLVEGSRQIVPNVPKGDLFRQRSRRAKVHSIRLKNDWPEILLNCSSYFKQVQPTVVASGREQVNNENESFNASFGLSQTQRDETIIGLNVHRNCRERFVEFGFDKRGQRN